MRLGLVTPDRIVSLHRIPGLSEIRVHKGALEIGAMASLAGLARHGALRAVAARSPRPRAAWPPRPSAARPPSGQSLLCGSGLRSRARPSLSRQPGAGGRFGGRARGAHRGVLHGLLRDGHRLRRGPHRSEGARGAAGRAERLREVLPALGRGQASHRGGRAPRPGRLEARGRDQDRPRRSRPHSHARARRRGGR